MRAHMVHSEVTDVIEVTLEISFGRLFSKRVPFTQSLEKAQDPTTNGLKTMIISVKH